MDASTPPGDHGARRTVSAVFRALQVRNFRLFVAGNMVSIVGTGAQTVGQGWLVVHELQRSGAALGVVLALSYLPLLVAAPLGGLFADRHDRRTILVATQALLGGCAAVLAVVTISGVVSYWMVCAVSAAVGLVTVFDTPARHSFAAELVGPAEVANAISVNSTIMHLARALGPLVATGLIASVGVGACFALNAASFVAIVVALVLLRTAEMHRVPRPARASGQVVAAFRYVAATPSLRTPLLLLAAIGTLTMNYTVLLPVFARDEMGGSSALGFMVPAECEFVLEARISPTETVHEGPFAEFLGYESADGPAPVMTVDAVTHRDDPVYFAVNGAGRETVMLRKYVLETAALRAMRTAVPIVSDVEMTPGGLYRFHLIAQVAKRSPQHDGLQRNAILAAFAALKDLDQVIVVDDDIDIRDPADVDWALATRMEASRDLVLIPGARGHEYVRVSDRGMRTKLGIDATVHYADRARFARAPFADVCLAEGDSTVDNARF